jgi:hypothetical protein
VVDQQLEAAIAAGNGLIVGWVGPDGEPRATRAWSAVVTDHATRRVRVVVGADDPSIEEHLNGGVLALTGADILTLQATQMKGPVVAVEEPSESDIVTMAAHSTAFFDMVMASDGSPIELLQRLLPARVVAVEFLVEELYDQSPGPGAGQRLGAEPA